MSSAEPPIGAGRRILVVEDEYLVASHLEMILQDLGFAVIGPLATIPEALAAIASEELDAVMLDANLDGISSAPIAVELSTQRLPFVVVTGYGNLELPGALQVAPRVHKPFTATSLSTVLVGLMESGTSADQSKSSPSGGGGSPQG